MNTLSETALNNDTGNHDDTLEQMNTLSETALNNDTGNHDDTMEQLNTLSETALNNNTGNHDDTLEQMNTLSETALKDHMTGNCISNGTREINQNVLSAEQNIKAIIMFTSIIV
jgi:ABC-type transporter Mla subunit MlaD